MKNKAGSVSKYLTKNGERLWRFRLDADSEDGKRRQRGRAGFKTKGDASEAMWAAIKEGIGRKLQEAIH